MLLIIINISRVIHNEKLRIRNSSKTRKRKYDPQKYWVKV